MASRLRVILGTGDFGKRVLAADEQCQAVIAAMLERGYTEVDTALMYGGGKSEQALGRVLKGTDLGKVVVATKANPWGAGRLKKESVVEQMSTSLANLQLPSVDIFYLHAPDHSTPLEETLAACNQLHQEGKFKEFGVSNYAAWEVADIHHICKNNGWICPTVYQGMYNPITRMVEPELLPALRHFGMRFYAYNPLACGVLTGKFKYSDIENKDQMTGRFFSDPKWSPVYRDRYWRKSVFDGVALISAALDDVYGQGKVSLVSASFRWMFHHSALKPEHHDGVVLGLSNKEQLLENLSGCEEGPLHQRVVEAFDAAWQLDRANSHNYFR